MKSLYGTLSKNREKLVGIAQSQMSSMKGGRAGAMLNPGRIRRTDPRYPASQMAVALGAARRRHAGACQILS